jgi:hypothetical protein
MQAMRLQRGCLQPTQSQFSIASRHRWVLRCCRLPTCKNCQYSRSHSYDGSAYTPFSAPHVNSEANLAGDYVCAALFWATALLFSFAGFTQRNPR